MILFKSGRSWEGQLNPKGSGRPERPIVIDKYGGETLPKIAADGRYPYTVHLFNQEYWEINNLEITNFLEGDSSLKIGVYIEAQDAGTVNHIYMRNLNIHHVNGDMSTKHNGGVFLEIKGNVTKTKFHDLRIEDCRISDVDRTGVSNRSSWDERTLTENISWYPSTQVIVRNNHFLRTGANALIIRVADSPLIEHNIFEECSVKGSGNACFTFNCDNALIQYNEAFLTRYNAGDRDAGGFDSDYRCKNTIIQYNYSHDNEYGGVLVCNNGDSKTAFNYGTVVRYNISQNNRHHTVRISGPTLNTMIYNNVFYVGKQQDSTVIIWHKSWGGYSDSTLYANNIFFATDTSSKYGLEKSTHNQFLNNLFYGFHPSNEPEDMNKLTADPLFIDPGKGKQGIQSLNCYRVQEGSPVRGAGIRLHDHAPYDFWGQPIGEGVSIDIGVHQQEEPVGSSTR